MSEAYRQIIARRNAEYLAGALPTRPLIFAGRVCASGGFDPLHVGHLEYLRLASRLGRLYVIVNRDAFLIRKKGFAFMPLADRMAIVGALRSVHRVVASIDDDQTVCRTLDKLRPQFFAKGGDRSKDEIPERETCARLGIEIVDGLGEKIRSSSDMTGRPK